MQKKDDLKAKKARDRNEMKTLRKDVAKRNRKAIQAETKLAKQRAKEAQKLMKQQRQSSSTPQSRKKNHVAPKRVRDESSISSSDKDALSDSVANPSQKKKLAAPTSKPAKSTSSPFFSDYDTATNDMCKWKM
jgi:hypothetical protein